MIELTATPDPATIPKLDAPFETAMPTFVVNKGLPDIIIDSDWKRKQEDESWDFVYDFSIPGTYRLDIAISIAEREPYVLAESLKVMVNGVEWEVFDHEDNGYWLGCYVGVASPEYTVSKENGIVSLPPASSATGEGRWYDLSGRQLSNGQMKKGIYIKDGKKVVLK